MEQHWGHGHVEGWERDGDRYVYVSVNNVMKKINESPRIIVLMGVSGSGKTTIGNELADKLGWGFIDADDFHPQSNIEKMSSGVPLTDDDRWPWLDNLHNLIEGYLVKDHSVVLACSALKESYRDRLLKDIPNFELVYLHGDYELIERRMRRRQGHFMDSGMLASQFETLEEPKDALIIDINADKEKILNDIIQNLGLLD